LPTWCWIIDEIALDAARSPGPVVLNCCAQQPGQNQQQEQQMRIVVEQQTGSAFRIVSPQHIFKTGDMIRFRVTSSADGFLYVSDRAASGKYSELFPAKGAGNRLEHGKDYRMPAATRAWFRIEPPAGYETIFFHLHFLAGTTQKRACQSICEAGATGFPC
jgi:hypothetical protein